MTSVSRSLLVALSLAITAGSVALLLATRHRPEPVTAMNAVGDAACLSCHRQYGTFEHTAHRLTSRRAVRAAIAGSFTAGENLLRTSNPALSYRLDSTAAGFVQTAVMGDPPNVNEHSELIALVVGSGRKGQTYLYAHGDRLFELPVSYWTSLGKWINSPGYLDGSVNFGRPATPRCLECHSTWFQTRADSQLSNRYDTTTAILGITCEKCHGAGAAHVARERSPLRVLGPAILNPARLSRARQIDGCAQCHGGAGQLEDAAFSYLPSQPLGRHLTLDRPPPGSQVDVHGNQVALLARSRCFQASSMTCATCHDVHRTQRDPTELSSRCLTCHQPQRHTPLPALGRALAGRCVDCHMPLQTSNLIISDYEGQQERPQVRTHWIKVYPDTLRTTR
ncbi:MAG TPA: multiheme c-type cytochrome [Gemmatimonadaceae bacterium]|nr:multiheme c-type cytochrome [Gemmatimonadaceae bacterium]